MFIEDSPNSEQREASTQSSILSFFVPKAQNMTEL